MDRDSQKQRSTLTHQRHHEREKPKTGGTCPFFFCQPQLPAQVAALALVRLGSVELVLLLLLQYLPSASSNGSTIPCSVACSQASLVGFSRGHATANEGWEAGANLDIHSRLLSSSSSSKSSPRSFASLSHLQHVKSHTVRFNFRFPTTTVRPIISERRGSSSLRATHLL